MIILNETLKKKTESNNCSIIHCFEENNYKHTDLCFYGCLQRCLSPGALPSPCTAFPQAFSVNSLR